MIGIKWERNSRALSLASDGKIASEDIIPRMKTEDFPAETATVRMAKPQDKSPFVTVHIRGKSKKRTYWHGGGTYECASTCRVNISNMWSGQDFGMSSNGELDPDLTWLDVHNAVMQVQETMEE